MLNYFQYRAAAACVCDAMFAQAAPPRRRPRMFTPRTRQHGRTQATRVCLRGARKRVCVRVCARAREFCLLTHLGLLLKRPLFCRVCARAWTPLSRTLFTVVRGMICTSWPRPLERVLAAAAVVGGRGFTRARAHTLLSSRNPTLRTRARPRAPA